MPGLANRLARYAVVVAAFWTTPCTSAVASASGSWTLPTIPAPAGTSRSVLTGVDCVTSAACVAVGNGSSDSETFGETSTGSTWRSSPIGRGGDPTAVSCATARFCLALGGADDAVVYRWNGTGWATVSKGLPASARLAGVSCVSKRFCMAVGSEGAQARRPLSAAWTGRRWRVATPPFAGIGGALDVVSCPSVADCFAAGDDEGPARRAANTTDLLIDRWNGSAWVNQHVTDYRHLADGASSISCTGATACMLVGSDTPQDQGVPEAFAERWNGHRWAVSLAGLPAQYRPPVAPAALAQLQSVSCWAPGRCLAIGESRSAAGSSLSTPLAMVWNEGRWQADPAAVPLGGQPDLLGVSCVRAGACTIVGDRGGAVFAERGATPSPGAG